MDNLVLAESPHPDGPPDPAAHPGTVQGKPLYLGFVNQKGGVGKSTLAGIVCSMLCYEYGVRLLALDCDGAQGSLAHLRKRDQAYLSTDEEFSQRLSAQHARLMVQAYPVEQVHASGALQLARGSEPDASCPGVDLVAFDFPGYLSDPQILDLALRMDYILFPVEPSMQSMQSSMINLDLLYAHGVRDPSEALRDVLVVWNKVDRRVSSLLIDFYSAELGRRAYTLLPSVVYASQSFRSELSTHGPRGAFLCTLQSPPRAARKSLGVDELVGEIIARLNLPVRIGRDMLN